MPMYVFHNTWSSCRFDRHPPHTHSRASVDRGDRIDDRIRARSRRRDERFFSRAFLMRTARDIMTPSSRYAR